VKPEQYPPQEPLSPLGAKYHARVMALGEGVEGIEAPYGDDPYQSLAVFPSARPNGDVLVFFPGGGWTSGYKEWMSFMAPAWNALGVTFVTAGYRLAPQHVFPAALEDCADAVAWVARHIEAHGGDPKRVFVGGQSAGGHHAALLGVTRPWRAARGLQGGVPAGCLPVSGSYRFGPDSGMAVRPRFLGPVEHGRAEFAAAPLRQLDPAACPRFYVSWGEQDFPHLAAQGREFVAALHAAGVPVETDVLPGCDHFDASIACGERDGGWPVRAARWMNHNGA
jgi:acetyl esterase/lipase